MKYPGWMWSRWPRSLPDISAQDLLGDVTCKNPYHIEGRGKRIAMIDLGIKRHILKSLSARGFDIHVLPAHSSISEIEAASPEALFLSNGPGDPERGSEGHRCRQALRRPDPGLRNMPGPPDHLPGPGSQDLQAQVRPPRRQPAREGSGKEDSLHHLSKPQLCRGSGFCRGHGPEDHPAQCQRRHS